VAPAKRDRLWHVVLSDCRRLALVIGSQCEGLPELAFLPAEPGRVEVSRLTPERRVLADLRDLLAEGPGDCVPLPAAAGLSGDGLLLNPTADQARVALSAAMDAAAESEAVLLVHVLAHGSGGMDDVVHDLLALWDTAADAHPADGWSPLADLHPGERRPGPAGLVLMIDSCRASSPGPSVHSWSGMLGAVPTAVLAATDAPEGWDARLTRTAIAALRGGVSAAAHPHRTLVAEVLTRDLELLAGARRALPAGNRALYVGRNPAADDVTSRLGLDPGTAALVLRLTRHYCDHAVSAIAAAAEQSRVVSVIGEAGTGKSTLAAALRLPPEGSEVPIGLVDAAAFVAATPDLAGLARSLAAQLGTLPGFEPAARRFASEAADDWGSLGVWQRELIGPLSVLRQPVRLLIDGIDELDGDDQALALRAALTELLEGAPRTSLVLIGGEEPLLPGATAVPMPALDERTARRFLQARSVSPLLHDRLIGLADGRWLVLRLAADHAATRPGSLEAIYAELIERATRVDPLVEQLLELLAAAGSGPRLPVDVLRAALVRLAGTPVTRAGLLALLGDEALAPILDRARPGASDDRVGVFHRTLADHLATARDLSHAHEAIAAALDDLAPDSGAYAFESQPGHWWHAGRVDRVLACLHRHENALPRVNLARWHRWASRFEAALGPVHPATLSARGNVAFWVGESGDGVGALARFEALLPDTERGLGPDHPSTLAIRRNLAQWAGEAGDARGALVRFEALLPDLERVLGADHPDALTTRADIAGWTGDTGDFAAALALATALLGDQERVLGADHPATLSSRAAVAYWTGEAGDPAGALVRFQELVPDLERALGADHHDVLAARQNVAFWTGRSGDARGALSLSEALLPELERELGPDHPQTLLTRGLIDHWTGVLAGRIS